MDLKNKVEVLGLKEIDENIYINHLKQWEKVDDLTKFKYYKMHYDTPMFYTEEYLNDNDIDTLIERNGVSQEFFTDLKND